MEYPPWNIKTGMLQQSGYGFCKGGKYVSISNADSKLQLGCARLRDKECIEGGRQKCEERIGLVLMQYGGSRAL